MKLRPEVFLLFAIGALIFFTVMVIKNTVQSEKRTKDTLICFTGTMGSGKTYACG